MEGRRLHYLIPADLDQSNSRDESLRAYKLKMEAQLQSDGALSFPSAEISQLLLQAYFAWFHPCFPILNRAELDRAYVNGNLSPLLLQAILFIGVSLCTDAAFARTEFETRYRAKLLFYSRARAIYDADWETNKMVKLQSLFLLSFWREEKAWRQIWWALYIRDQQSAAALGLLPRIRDKDCDVTMLSTDDVRDDKPIADDCVIGTQSAEYLHYPVEMAKLARILRKIVST
ncbi:fungal specific transcription factor domain-containing protein [Aspergillus clavatus NRRL 1]|uniref:Xylanolytic transcriptional activator regulatory domain-containing protein n=1 Tax=Aspergillus clavatus (strain ATCC 1007 / CBS 513.65 / DSM 816 / NCTC 3887 / NRRL 1 / QM 1276 / 107) TaxID=344612 RepID=A1CDY8_ASPCL|nr:uncharacterized protein ACLA_008250 [Aspergillus clavatus NRRL 1]EAW12065.1 predicted protein [Aspergillus clavatus NRRL 1]